MEGVIDRYVEARMEMMEGQWQGMDVDAEE